MTLKIMGDRIQLIENQLRAQPFSRSTRRRNTGVSFGGYQNGPHADVVILAKNIMGLNDIRSVEIPITSDRFSEAINGWYRIQRANVSVNKMTNQTSRITWRISGTRMRGEFDMLVVGVTRENTQGPSNAVLNGAPTIGVPDAAQGIFFPAALAAPPLKKTFLLDTRWSRNGEQMNIYRERSPSTNEFTRGVRYTLPPENGDLGQCIVDVNGAPAVGLQERTFAQATGDAWLISNGLVTVAQEHGRLIRVTYANTVGLYSWSIRYRNTTGTTVAFPSRLGIISNLYHTAAIRLLYSSVAGGDTYDSGMLMVLRRGQRFMTVSNFRGSIEAVGSGDSSTARWFNLVGNNPALTPAQQGVMQIGGNNPNISGKNISLTMPGTDVAYIYVDGDTTGQDSTRSYIRHQEWLGSSSQTIRTIPL